MRSALKEQSLPLTPDDFGRKARAAKRKTILEKYAKLISTLLFFMLFLCIFFMVTTVILAMRLFRDEKMSSSHRDQNELIQLEKNVRANEEFSSSTVPVPSGSSEDLSIFSTDLSDTETSPETITEETIRSSEIDIDHELISTFKATVQQSDNVKPDVRSSTYGETASGKLDSSTITSPAPCPTSSTKNNDRPVPTTGPQQSSTARGPLENSTCYIIDKSDGWRQASENIRKSMDIMADPCEDFHQYSCGVWALRNPLPENVSSLTQYSVVSQQTLNDTRMAIESINTASAPKALVKLKTAYEICLNGSRSEEMRGKPIAQVLTQEGLGQWPLIVSNWASRNFQVEPLIAKLMGDYGLETVFHAKVQPYPLNSSEIVMELRGNERYTKNKLHHSKLNKYTDIIYETARLLSKDLKTTGTHGYRSPSRRDVLDIVNLEQKLAEIAGSVDRTIQKWNVSYLQSQIPKFSWDRFFQKLLPGKVIKSRYSSAFPIHVVSPEFLLKLTDLIQNMNHRVLQNYFVWSYIRTSLPFLSSDYRSLYDRLSALISGNPRSHSENWQDCILHFKYGSAAGSLGYAVGRAYVNEHFSSVLKYDVQHIATDIARSFTDMVQSSPWMDSQTKFHAMQKIRSMKLHVGYPDWIADDAELDSFYSDFHVTAENSLFDVIRIMKSWSFQKSLHTLLEPSEKPEFGGPPSETNAWHNAPGNSITIPAGEIRAPFYGISYPQAVNYGAIGYVIGHEMAHGFDTSGSMYDSNGNLHDWWSQTSRKEFLNKTSCVLNEYSRFCYPSLNLCVDGAKTEQEDSADIAGLKAAFIAFKKYSRDGKDYKSLPGLESFSQDQIFFLSFASFWCGATKETALKRQLLHYGYTPDKFRVLGTLRNLPEFSKAFHCPVGSYLNPVNRCDLW